MSWVGKFHVGLHAVNYNMASVVLFNYKKRTTKFRRIGIIICLEAI